MSVDFSLTWNRSDRTRVLGSTQPLTEMSTRSISWGKGGRCLRLTTYHHPVPISRNLGTFTFRNPLSLSGPVMGLICLLFSDVIIIHTIQRQLYMNDFEYGALVEWLTVYNLTYSEQDLSQELWRWCIVIDVTGVWDISHRLWLKNAGCLRVSSGQRTATTYGGGPFRKGQVILRYFHRNSENNQNVMWKKRRELSKSFPTSADQKLWQWD